MTDPGSTAWDEHEQSAAERLRERQLELLQTRHYSYGDRRSSARIGHSTQPDRHKGVRLTRVSLRLLFGRGRTD